MAIKRTITRRYGVRPVQMDVSSGGLALAQASQNVANTVSNVTKFIDDNQFQEAVLNAEIQGRRIGSQTITDDNGNIIPKPLDQMTLNSFTADIYNKSNIRKAQQYFKKEAINSYGLALQNHAISVSEKSLLENQGKVDESGSLVVEKASKSYIDSIKSTVAPEVFDVILLDGGEFTTYFELPITPIIIGNCASSPSKKNPITTSPGANLIGFATPALPDPH